MPLAVAICRNFEQNGIGLSQSSSKPHKQSHRYFDSFGSLNSSIKHGIGWFSDGAGSAVLRTVLEHEIGHLSGFGHSLTSPVMGSNYNPRADPSLLSDADLISLKETYGKCKL